MYNFLFKTYFIKPQKLIGLHIYPPYVQPPKTCKYVLLESVYLFSQYLRYSHLLLIFSQPAHKQAFLQLLDPRKTPYEKF